MPIIVSHDPLTWQSYDAQSASYDSADSMRMEVAQAWDAMARNAVVRWRQAHDDENSLEARYDLGKCIRRIYDSDGFVKSELPLLLVNFRLHLGQERKARHGMNDYSLMYWFRLSAFTKKVVLKLTLTQWVDCFETNALSEDDFIVWFVRFIRSRYVSPEALKIFRIILNANIAKMSLDHISKVSKRRIYESNMEAALLLANGVGELNNRESTNTMRSTVASQRKLFNDVMIGAITPIDYATRFVNELNQIEVNASPQKGVAQVVEDE